MHLSALYIRNSPMQLKSSENNDSNMQVLQECQCLMVEQTCTDEQLEAANYQLCGNVTAVNGSGLSAGNIDLVGAFGSLVCADKAYHDAHERCMKECLPPCSEYIYGESISSAGSWPGVNFQPNFYHSYISGTEYEDKFSIYKDTLDKLKAANVVGS